MRSLNPQPAPPLDMTVNSAEVGPVSADEVDRAVAGLRGLGFAQRLMILVVLQEGAATPAMLAEALPHGTGALPFHLRALLSTGLVRRERRGINVYYSQADTATGDLVRSVIAFAKAAG